MSPGNVPAQTNPPPKLDPLMSLMISQPRLTTSGTVQATASFDPPAIAPGGWSFYRVTITAPEECIDWPTNLAAPAGLDIQPGARGQVFQMFGPNPGPHTAFNYRVRARAAGEYTLPSIQLKVSDKLLSVPPARLIVTADPAAANAPRLLTMELAGSNVFAGQPVSARVLLRGTDAGAVQTLAQVQLVGPGLLVDLGGSRQVVERRPRNGVDVPTFIYETTLTPMRAGKLAIIAQGFSTGLQLSAPIVIKGPATFTADPYQTTLLESDPVELNVRPLPTEGELPGFTGAIGSFIFDSPRVATNQLRVGDPVQLAITVRGEGNLGRLVAPPPPRVAEWQVMAASTEYGTADPRSQPATLLNLSSVTATFRYVLVPLTSTARATPLIPFSYFDPERSAYTDLSFPPVPVTVAPGPTNDFQALAQSSSANAAREKEPTLSPLASKPGRTGRSLVPWQERAWFLLTQLALAAGFVSLGLWDRRRRYLQQHPEIVIRRRARRALRRELRALRDAARAGDTPRFAAAAVAALRIASAPHYQAEAGALVGSDILPLLSETDSSHRHAQVVGRLFAATDAARFAAVPGDSTDLLTLKPDLERVLEQLEARL